MSTLTLPSVNGSPRVEYRDIDGHPVPYMVTIQRRSLRSDGSAWRDGGSDWETITAGDLLAQLHLDGPVARWLREETRVACDARTIASYAAPGDPAYLRSTAW